jgi:hypothetical protein
LQRSNENETNVPCSSSVPYHSYHHRARPSAFSSLPFSSALGRKFN